MREYYIIVSIAFVLCIIAAIALIQKVIYDIRNDRLYWDEDELIFKTWDEIKNIPHIED